MMSSNTKNILILLVALLLSGLVVVWILFVNKGTLTVSANPPFSVYISPLVGGKECLTETCSYSIKPDSYSVTFKKTGYFEKSVDVSVDLFKTATLSHEFVAIPELKPYAGFKIPEYPEGFAEVVNNLDARKIASIFLGKDINGFDRIFASHIDFSRYSSVSVSPYFHYALFTDTQGQVSLFDIQNNTDLGIIADLKNTQFSWSLSEKYIYFFHDGEDKQLLSRYLITDSKSELLTSFLRPITQMRLYPSPDDSQLIIAEITEDDTSVYALDMSNLRKKRILSVPNLAGWKWSPNAERAVYQVNSAVNGSPLITLYETQSGNLHELKIPVSLGFIEWINNSELVIVANALLQQYLSEGGVENLDSLSYKFNLASDGINVIDNDVIMIYDSVNDSWRNLTIKSTTPLQISDLMMHPSQNSLWILSQGILYSIDIL